MQRYFGRIMGNQVILEDDDVFHLSRVMRAKVGDKIEVVADGVPYIAKISRFKPIQIDVIRQIKENHELPNDIILVASLIKGDKMDLVLQKATELGVNEVVLLQTERTVVKIKPADKELKLHRYRKILKEAAEQSKRCQIPHLFRILDIHNLQDVDADIKIIAYEGMEGPSASFNKIVNSIKPKQKIAVLIGPEGGFSDKEVAIATDIGFKQVSLGRRILRAETATFYALSVIAHHLEIK